jgi:hypothetical protein
LVIPCGELLSTRLASNVLKPTLKSLALAAVGFLNLSGIGFEIAAFRRSGAEELVHSPLGFGEGAVERVF